MSIKPLSCVFGKFHIPQIYILVIMIMFGVWNAYHLREVLNIAMAEMRAPSNDSRLVDACPMYKEDDVKNIAGGRYNWTSTQESMLLGGFYFGYLLGHLPGGWLADKVGARHVMGVSIIGSAILTLSYPIVIEKLNFAVAVLLRVIIGIVQGPTFPCISTYIQSWIPHKHLSFLGAIAYAGSSIGPITGNLLTGIMIVSTSSWRTPFYVWPLVAIIWYIFYLFMVFSKPDTHPFITEGELEYLKNELPKKVKFKVPWKSLVTSPPIYALISGQFGHDYIYHTILVVNKIFERYFETEYQV